MLFFIISLYVTWWSYWRVGVDKRKQTRKNRLLKKDLKFDLSTENDCHILDIVAGVTSTICKQVDVQIRGQVRGTRNILERN